MKRSTKLSVLLPALLLAGSAAVGCAGSTPPPRELIEARSTYQQAASNPGATAAQNEVADAKKALDRAEAAYADDPGGDATRDWAYIATRKAASARAKASAMSALDDGKLAQVELRDLREQQQAMQRRELDKTREQLAGERAELSSEKQARISAEEKTKDALTKIAGMTSAQSARGLVLTLAGGVLFATGKSVLLPAAQARLSEAAKVIGADGRSITVVGHTDAAGNEDTNQALSVKRAEAVRTYLMTHGVPSDRIKAEGAGETQPVADNATIEGRANNRRVEIVLENGKP